LFSREYLLGTKYLISADLRSAFIFRRVRQAQTEQRSHSVGSSIWRNYDDTQLYKSILSGRSIVKVLFREMIPPVQAKLIALDHRGFRTVVIEKLKPGPFGFYIATGIINQRRGIFISRVSLPSLMPVLSVGDELIYVENELIKGRTLEYVQSLIAGKNIVTIVLLPNISSALC
uniref:PDZ domain-containing protein n=1 Tax=Enterobius vermicularis TaxID=51028 RepID=A0A158QB18_ENTVE